MYEAVACAEITVDLPVAEAFDAVTKVDLRTILTGYAFLPAVAGVEDQIGDWDAPGQTRTIRLADSSAVREEIDEVEKPRRFAYHIGGFTSALGYLASGARGEFLFEEKSPGVTAVRWTYTYTATSVLVAPLVALIIKVFWRAYMERGLAATKREAERLTRI